MKKIIMLCLMAVIGFGVSDAMAQKKSDAALHAGFTSPCSDERSAI